MNATNCIVVCPMSARAYPLTSKTNGQESVSLLFKSRVFDRYHPHWIYLQLDVCVGYMSVLLTICMRLWAGGMGHLNFRLSDYHGSLDDILTLLWRSMASQNLLIKAKRSTRLTMRISSQVIGLYRDSAVKCSGVS